MFGRVDPVMVVGRYQQATQFTSITTSCRNHTRNCGHFSHPLHLRNENHPPELPKIMKNNLLTILEFHKGEAQDCVPWPQVVTASFS